MVTVFLFQISKLKKKNEEKKEEALILRLKYTSSFLLLLFLSFLDDLVELRMILKAKVNLVILLNHAILL